MACEREKSVCPSRDSAVLDSNANEGQESENQLIKGTDPLASAHPLPAAASGVVPLCSGVDPRLRWPLGVNIAHPTPQHRDGVGPYVRGNGGGKPATSLQLDDKNPDVRGNGGIKQTATLQQDGENPDVRGNGEVTSLDGENRDMRGNGGTLDGQNLDVRRSVAGRADMRNEAPPPGVVIPSANADAYASNEVQKCALPLATAAMLEGGSAGHIGPPHQEGVVPSPQSSPAKDMVSCALHTGSGSSGVCELADTESCGHLEHQSLINSNHTASSDVQQTTVYDYSNESPPHTCGSKTLVFESRFESGNLYKATQVSQYHYNLQLRTDLYTDRHTQWYYFKVSNMEAMVTYTFSITNLMKRESLYQEGMKPLLYSEREVASGGCGWSRVGHHISYQPTAPLEELATGGGGGGGGGGDIQHYNPDLANGRMDWGWGLIEEDIREFLWSGDQCYLAHCYPYPYTKLLSYLDGLGTSQEKKKFVKRETLCHTLAGNICPVLTITDFTASEQVMVGRRGVVISARVHPGETNGSWMMQGVLDTLTSNSKLARSLRSNFVFRLVPMLNPDGVVVGNYRTSLAGLDLNRVYKKPSRELCPTVWSIKKMIEEMMEDREVILYVDLHGHSHKQNIFNYGCHDRDCDHTQFLNERVFCFLLSQLAPDKFSFPSCKFSIRKSKRRTGRVIVWKMGVANSFTMEASFCGSTLRPQASDQVDHFTTEDLVSMGQSLCEAIHKYHHFLNSTSYQRDILALLAEQLMMKWEGSPGEEEIATPTLVQPPPLLAIAPPTSIAKDSCKATAVLNRFMTLDLKLLERESSTSGSDGENTHTSKQAHLKTNKRRKKRRKKRAMCLAGHVGEGPQSMLRLPHPVHLISIASVPFNDSSRPNGPQTSPVGRAVKYKDLQPSTPRSKLEILPATTRFINRYANRSNGGIPMFAEERLRERQEKIRLLQKTKSTTCIEGPLLTSTHPHTFTPPTTHLTPSSIPLLWKPMNTHDNRDGHNTITERVNQHYQRVRDLVEGHQYDGGRQFELHVKDVVGELQKEPLKPRSFSEGDLKVTPTFSKHLRGVHHVRSRDLHMGYRPGASCQDHTHSTSHQDHTHPSSGNFANCSDRVWRSAR
eukprot:Em0005g1603a